MASDVDQPTHTARAIFVAAVVSSLLAPFAYGAIGGLQDGGGLAAGVGFLMLAATFGAPFLAILFVAAWSLGSLFRHWHIRHIAAFVFCGALLGLSAPVLLGLGVESRVGGGNVNWAIPFGAFATGAAAGALDGAVFWLLAEIVSRSARRSASQ
jgi:hypothetical protein